MEVNIKAGTDDSETRLGLISHGNRLATVFDQATEIRLFEIIEDKIYPAGHLSLPFGDLMGKISLIKSCGVNILICGAISCCAHNMLKQKDIALIPWITGDLDRVIAAFETQHLHELSMPGCHTPVEPGRCRVRRRGSGQICNRRIK
ncbi:MAG: NifB/NifX family molybdenum-iron cluster-binding protein [Desulfonatronovibrionaceae bacterium]